MIHFGCSFKKDEADLLLSRENYLYKKRNGEYPLRFGGIWTADDIAEHEQICLDNFDLNMLFYDQLDGVQFDNQIERLKFEFPDFVEITDLTQEKERYGIYAMILDEYKQIYIGKTRKNFFYRIKKHWSDNVEFDRLIFGDWRKSKLPIDSFKALDTTRILVMPLEGYSEEDILIVEQVLVESIDEVFLANRLSGGSIQWSNRLTPYMCSKVKFRNL
ncbi:hypothetical protein [Adlercreutzia muris]|uniref:GIY-YIG nuclease family protein n=2 Tax=Adlercreutzia muris TaxID=1796610 RepID=A0A7C8BTY3_9ACTN|nr:hypothetical protein [Adlercreutzia muris]KAB1647738.1 hypothetical protein F8D48_06835 [Adlercreutzia muris]MCR2027367.1 hypothetical protein [Adlercreutzia muris]